MKNFLINLWIFFLFFLKVSFGSDLAFITNQLSNKKLYVIDAFCGANKDTCLKVRFVMEVAWQAHFVKNMFIKSCS